MSTVQPETSAFEQVYQQGKPQLVWTTLVADLETPVSAYLKLSDGETNTFLLESVEDAANRGRYSFIGIKPDLIWKCDGKRAALNRTALNEPQAFVEEPQAPLTSFRAVLAESLIDLPEELPPMAAGMVGYMGYDMIRLIETLPDVPPDALGTPDGLFVRPTVMVIFDSVKDVMSVCTPVRPEEGLSASAARARAEERLNEAIVALQHATPRAAEDRLPMDAPALPAPVSNTSEGEYMGMVDKAKEYIAAGDIFQVVLSQRFEMPFELPPLSLYRALRRTNPSPYMYFMEFEGFAIAGSSPEILVRVAEDEVTIRPIAGTRPRGATTAEDEELKADLLADPKELAEHLMLLDLGRNDVGRVAKPGTVRVTESYSTELYSHVMHIVSNVIGELDPKYDAVDALTGGFPAGTVSGAPKIRAMEIIDELEKEKRGVYAGGVGYFSAGGAMDTCIVLSTAIVKDGKMYVQAGAGIVADSVPLNEQRECEAKARALVRAAEEAVRYATEPGRGQ